MNKKFKFTKVDLTKLLLAMVFVSLVFLPLFYMFTNMDTKSMENIISSPNFGVTVKNSAISTTIATIITIIVAYVMAMFIERTNIKGKEIFSVLFVLPMLVPSISNGMGLTILFGNNGILTKVLGLRGNIYGLSGVVVGSVLYAFPVAFLMFRDVIRYDDGSPYEAAKVLGISKLRQFTAI